jgi:hypothetical protein
LRTTSTAMATSAKLLASKVYFAALLLRASTKAIAATIAGPTKPPAATIASRIGPKPAGLDHCATPDASACIEN